MAATIAADVSADAGTVDVHSDLSGDDFMPTVPEKDPKSVNEDDIKKDVGHDDGHGPKDEGPRKKNRRLEKQS